MEDCLAFKERLRSLWRRYVLTGNLAPDPEIRPEIYASWCRCKEAGVDPLQKVVPKVLDEAALAERRARTARLIEIARPVMENLYRFVAGSGFMVVLADAQGFLLEIVGDPETVASAARGNFCAGADWSETVAGTNAVGTCLVTGQPLQVFSYEHYCVCSHRWCCSAAPIFDPRGNLLGAIDMTGTFEKVHSHTLGMVVAAAHAIRNQLALHEALAASEAANEFKAAVFEAVSDGLMVVDRAGRVTHLNPVAGRILGLRAQDVTGRRVAEVLGASNRQLLRLITGAGTEGVSDWEVGIRTPNGGNRCLVTCRVVREGHGESLGLVVILKEIGRVKRVVQRMAGARAYYTFEQIVGRNPRFRQTVELARTAAGSPSNILLVGESGTGKELFAQAIHNASVRRSGPFVALNCAAVPRELIASELFGYAEGAFTGARKGGNPGKFELADGGTIFLDEIGEMPPELQAVLLRVLEERSVVRVGGNEVIPVDVRVIAATNTDLRAAVERGTFRKDLFYRLNVITIEMIPLRERKDDLPLLCRAFLSRANARLGKNLQGLDPAVERLFAEYAWPGNVRELSNVIEYAANVSWGPSITVEDLPVQFRRGDGEGPREAGLAGSLVDFERSLISATLARHAGNKTRAARDLGIARSTLYRKLKKKPLQG